MDIDLMPAGREMDALVAEKVMGEPKPIIVDDWDSVFSRWLDGCPIESPKEAWLEACLYEHGDTQEWIPRPFSTDIAAAWQVMEKLKDKFFCGIEFCGDCWQASMQEREGGLDYVEGNADTAPIAICRVALKAMGREYA
jgi:hypothetical protein